MTMPLGWSDADEVGYQLSQSHPGLDPMAVGFPELHKLVMRVTGFTDDPKASNEGKLEAIQMAWLEHYRNQ